MVTQIINSVQRRSSGQACEGQEPVLQKGAGRRTRWRPGLRCRRGAAVVEFAVVSPVFFLLTFGMIEYGRMVMVQQILTNAAREGARVAVLDTSTTSDVTTACNQYLSSANINGAVITVSPSPPSSAAAGAPVSVTVSVGFKKVSWLPSPMFLGSTTMTFTATMRRETMP